MIQNGDNERGINISRTKTRALEDVSREWLLLGARRVIDPRADMYVTTRLPTNEQ